MGCGGILEGLSGPASSEMDSWYARHPKAERLFQHNLIKNNQCRQAILDIEYAGRTRAGNLIRRDMLGVVRADDKYKLIIFENRFGGGAIGGAACLRKHYEDIVDVLSNPDSRADLLLPSSRLLASKSSMGCSGDRWTSGPTWI